MLALRRQAGLRELWFAGPKACRLLELRLMGLAASQYVESRWTSDQTCVSCTGGFLSTVSPEKSRVLTTSVCLVNYYSIQHDTQFSSVAQSCLTLCDPMDCSTPGFPVHHQLPELAQTHVHRVVMPSNHLILLHLLLLLPSVFPSIRIFSNESVLPVRWPKYWSFTFNISPSNEYSD